jgi:hypothetical protein
MKYEVLVKADVGKAYGHVPGHQFHDVNITVSRRQSPHSMWKVEIEEVAGSSQGYDEIHHRIKVSARSSSWRDAMRVANARAVTGGVDNGYLVQAISAAEDGLDDLPD